jgi:hypothetical protein
MNERAAGRERSKRKNSRRGGGGAERKAAQKTALETADIKSLTRTGERTSIRETRAGEEKTLVGSQGVRCRRRGECRRKWE